MLEIKIIMIKLFVVHFASNSIVCSINFIANLYKACSKWVFGTKFYFSVTDQQLQSKTRHFGSYNWFLKTGVCVCKPVSLKITNEWTENKWTCREFSSSFIPHPKWLSVVFGLLGYCPAVISPLRNTTSSNRDLFLLIRERGWGYKLGPGGWGLIRNHLWVQEGEAHFEPKFLTDCMTAGEFLNLWAVTVFVDWDLGTRSTRRGM